MSNSHGSSGWWGTSSPVPGHLLPLWGQWQPWGPTRAPCSCSQAVGMEVSDCITGRACAGAPSRGPPPPELQMAGWVVGCAVLCGPSWPSGGSRVCFSSLDILSCHLLLKREEGRAGRRWCSRPVSGLVRGPFWKACIMAGWGFGCRINQGKNPLCQRHLCAPPGRPWALFHP